MVLRLVFRVWGMKEWNEKREASGSWKCGSLIQTGDVAETQTEYCRSLNEYQHYFPTVEIR